jgi:KDO2-lipid IV(A) lauroyltransferase
MSKRGGVQTNLEYATARLLLAGLGLLPRQLAVGIGRMLGRTTYRMSRTLRRTGERNLELAFPALSRPERVRILRGCFISLGRQLGEFSHFAKLNTDNLRSLVECEGLENLDAARASGRGAILFTAHLGAWELSSVALSVLGYPVSFLVRRLDNPKIERLLEQARTRFGNRTMDKRSAMRPMLRTLKAGGTLGLLVDVNMLAHEGIFVDFFGTPASTTFDLAKLALRIKAPVMPVFAPWEERRQRFVLHIGAPLNIEYTGDEDQDVLRFTSLFTRVIEDYIRLYPDQWLWIHKRWRTRPAGESDLYKPSQQNHQTLL